MSEFRVFVNWESVKSKIFLHLVNYERNKEDIEEKMYVLFLDLAILIYCDMKEIGGDGFYIEKDYHLMWNQSIENIIQIALENTFYKDNTLVTPIFNLLPKEETYVPWGKIEFNTEKVMTVFTNRSNSFGAAMMLNTYELKKMADQYDSDLYILPSSVHEVLAVCADQDVDLVYLMNMVNCINRYVIDPEDYLSDNIYFFDRAKCEVTRAVPT